MHDSKLRCAPFRSQALYRNAIHRIFINGGVCLSFKHGIELLRTKNLYLARRTHWTQQHLYRIFHIEQSVYVCALHGGACKQLAERYIKDAFIRR